MCGIAGIIDFRGRPIERHILEGFCRSLAHRGPDDSGIWQHQADGFSVGLAHTRLAVIDPTPDARQPMLDASQRYALSYNGELYNYRELREQLPTKPRTASDTEVVLQACIAWGPDAFKRFDAMWALAFVDVHNRTGLLARDPFGIKPLYYLYHDHRLIFASELAAIRRLPDMPHAIDPDALGLYLNLGFIPHPHTIYQHVRKLSPGHLLRFDSSGPKEPERYHHLTPQPFAVSRPYEETCTELRQKIQTAVNRQTVADVPVGAFLSGGLDSSIIVASLAAPHSLKSEISNLKSDFRPIKTFSIGYTDHPRYDETHYARIVANHFHTDHHEFRLSFRDILDTIEPVLDHLGEPFADSSLLPTSMVSRYTRQHVTVALSGDGGDELFGGYWRYLGHHYLDRYHRIPKLLRRALIEPLLNALPSARSTPMLDRLRKIQKLLRAEKLQTPMERHLAWARLLTDAQSTQLLGEPATHRSIELLESMYASTSLPLAPSPPRPLASILLADLTIGLPADMLFKVDAASMQHSLEVRVPFLSPDLVQFVTSLPLEYKINGTNTKRILKDAYRSILPPAILQRKKMGFEVPIGEFLRHELRDFYHDTVTTSALTDLNLNPAVIARIYDQHLQRQADHADLLWALLTLCHWHRRKP